MASVDGGVSTLIARLPPPRMIRSRAITAASTQIGKSVGQGERGDAADLHAGQLHRLVRRGERGLAHLESLADDTVDVEPGRRQHHARNGRGVSPLPTTMIVLAESSGE